MKKLIYTAAILICGTAMAQEKPTEIKKETTVKTVKFKNGKDTKEGKIKVTSEETANVKLDPNDKYKVNQRRIAAEKKVKNTIMIDNDADAAYDVLTSETFYVNKNNDYRFSPDKSGFTMALSNEKNDFVDIGKAWSSTNTKTYIIKGEMYNGIGYFDSKGNFIVEYYNEDTQAIDTMMFSERKESM